jgi:hypothetical protein
MPIRLPDLTAQVPPEVEKCVRHVRDQTRSVLSPIIHQLRNADLIINVALGTDVNRNDYLAIPDPGFAKAKTKYETFVKVARAGAQPSRQRSANPSADPAPTAAPQKPGVDSGTLRFREGTDELSPRQCRTKTDIFLGHAAPAKRRQLLWPRFCKSIGFQQELAAGEYFTIP